MVDIESVQLPIVFGALGAAVGSVALDRPDFVLLAPLLGGVAAYGAGMLTPPTTDRESRAEQ